MSMYGQNAERQSRTIDKLTRELGIDVMTALEDEGTQEVQLNPDGKLWTEHFAHGRRKLGLMSASQAWSLMDTIADTLGVVVNHDNPLLEGELPIRDCRFAGAIPPIVVNPAFSIRTPATKIYTLDDYVAAEIMTRAEADAIIAATIAGQNILVAGGTGSGKTTLLNAIFFALSLHLPDTRIAIIEDTRELQCPLENTFAMRTKVTGTPITMQRLLEFSLRIKPDRICCGEVRNHSAAALVEAWNTGHDGGLGTVHANSATEATGRMIDLLRQANIPEEVAKRQISTAVHMIISIQKRQHGKRRIEEIVRVKGLRDGEFVFESI